ncbi:hypothetical protein [Promicromonospora aerolata]|uniref:SUKH-4 immunity protein of toxin-antitoxin system n=1 Tax=Promicromonospora aerolata TaxID=195749 RepID=A0ABW4VI05_9MICO
MADLAWLERATRHPMDYMASAFDDAVRDISAQGVTDLAGSDTTLPDDLTWFLQDGGLRDRLRSATSSYFDLGDTAVTVDGGRLVHLISDSQWVFHWLLYLGEDGSSAVVGTGFPAGFDLDADEYEDADCLHEDRHYILVADSFAEFIWRWWMDNEIFYRAVVGKASLTTEQEAYVAQYGPPTSLD